MAVEGGPADRMRVLPGPSARGILLPAVPRSARVAAEYRLLDANFHRVEYEQRGAT